MAPKKRKEPSQSHTLIDFFSNNAPIKKSKLQSPPTKTDKNSENFKTPAPREIIIIDSDSDDCSPRRDKGKTPAIPNAERHRSQAKRVKEALYCTKQSEWKSCLTRVTPSSKPQVPHDGQFTFGRPSTLLQTPVHSGANTVARSRTSSDIETTSTASIFGVPTSLLRSSVGPAYNPPLNYGEASMEDDRTFDPHNDPTSNEHVGDILHSIDCKSDDEQWDAGDDELAVLEGFDDDMTVDDVPERLHDYVQSSHSASCPVCGRDLSCLLGLVSDITTATDSSNPRFRREKTMSTNVSTPLPVPRVSHTFQVL